MKHVYRAIAFVTLLVGFIAGLTHMDQWIGLVLFCGIGLVVLAGLCLVADDEAFW